MKTRKYSKEIVDEICKFLNGDDWYYSFNEQKGVFDFRLRIRGKMRNISYSVRINESDFSVYATSPVNADSDDEEMMANMAEFICRVNYGLKRGDFEFDFRDGKVRYKIHIPCDNIIPSTEIIKDSIYCPARMFDKYGDGILSIIFNNASAKDAIKQCEDSGESEFERLLAEIMEEYPDDDTDALTTRIAERLGLSNSSSESIDDSNDESESDVEIEETEIKTDLFGKKGSAD